jgi:hypothetical protein
MPTMQSRGRSRSRRATALAFAGLLTLTGTGALAQEREGPSVRGSVRGELRRGSQARFEVTATHPAGWRAVENVLVTLELHGAALEEVAYDVAGSVIAVGGTRAVVGTGNAVAGRFLRVGAFGVTLATGGNRLALSFGARILEEIPPQARFRFTAEDDEGASASATVRAAVPEDDGGGLSVGTLALAALGALLAGGYLGARVASHRRRPSIYETVARRITEEREARGRPAR